MNVKIFCDGSCLGNGKAENFGGYGVAIIVNDKVFKTYNKGYKNTTNSRMELEGLLAAINAAKTLNQEVSIFSDSSYCVNTVNSWMGSWAANGWIKKSDKKPPENLDLIKQLYEKLNFDTNIHVLKTKGHADDKFNNLADKLAVAASTAEQTKYIKRLIQ